MKKNVLYSFLLLVLVSLFMVACQTPAVEETAVVSAQDTSAPLPVAYSGDFPRLAFDTVMPTGQSVAVECQDAGGDYPYTPYDWPDASATLEIRQGAGKSVVSIDIKKAKPDTYYTTWLRLKGETPNGESFGGNPLMGIPGTPLLPSSELNNALDAVSTPNDSSINGFYTDEDGNATFSIELDFPIINGSYPFHKFEGFDASDGRFLLDAPSAQPVAIAGKGSAPFTIRIASHCVDGLGHGLLPGPHEGWFDWVME
ncbi:MAG: hypothetical protein AAF490_22340 [Chloroflexota bacterium]